MKLILTGIDEYCIDLSILHNSINIILLSNVIIFVIRVLINCCSKHYVDIGSRYFFIIYQLLFENLVKANQNTICNKNCIIRELILYY